MSFSIPRSTTQKILVALLVLSIGLCSFAKDDAKDDLIDQFLDLHTHQRTHNHLKFHVHIPHFHVPHRHHTHFPHRHHIHAPHRHHIHVPHRHHIHVPHRHHIHAPHRHHIHVPHVHIASEKRRRRLSLDGTPFCKAALKPQKYEMKGCPVTSWFQKVPNSFGKWEKLLLDKFTGAWRKSGRTPSADENDHNYDTFLGQGNTLGFVSGTLEIDPSALDQEHGGKWYDKLQLFRKKRSYSKYKTGLFGAKGRYNAVVRFSDFGADGTVQLGRLALKLAYDPSLPQFACDECNALPWNGEMNLLLTETLETFPLGGFDALGVFAKDASKGWTEKLLLMYQSAKSFLGSLTAVLREFRWGDILGKTYFSQLPYRLVGTDGTEAAFRFRLRALNVARDSGVGRNKDDVVKYVRKMMKSRNVVYALEITINDNKDERNTVETDVAQDWDEPWVRVGTLTLPAQALNERGMAEALHSSLAKAVHPTDVASSSLDKLFFFHPVMTSALHRGIGEIQSFRADFYSQHAAARFTTYLDVPGFKPTTASQQQPPYPKFPFCAIDAKAVGWAAPPPKC